MNRFSKEFAKRIITSSFNYHRKGNKKDILIISSPRSGSTWLMNILYTQPGIKYLDETLSKNILDYNKFLPIKTRWNYISLTKFEENIFKDYFSNDKPIRHFGPVNIFNKNYNFFTNRRVFKIIRANALIEWFEKNFNFEIVYLIRHPIAQSLSCIKRGHHCEIPEYLINEQFVKKYLNENLKNYIQDVLDFGTNIEKFIVEWCLDNLIPLKKINEQNYSWLVLTYEELVLKPEKIINLLSERLDLPNIRKMLEEINVPSKVTNSSTKETSKKIKEKDSIFLIKKWKKEITDKKEKELFEILQRFNIQAYHFKQFIAKDKLLNFKK